MNDHGFIPQIVLLAGPNGAGKSTTAPALLRDELRVSAFVNADDIAHGLSAFAPQAAAVAAGRVMLQHIAALIHLRADFAFETTLAGRTAGTILEKARAEGYDTHLIFLWLPSVELALERVRTRHASGGHDVAETDVRRRFTRGLINFSERYRSKCTTWRIFDASSPQLDVLVARGSGDDVVTVVDPGRWAMIETGGASARRVRSQHG